MPSSASTPWIHDVLERSHLRSPVLVRTSHGGTKTRRKLPSQRAAVALFASLSGLPPSLPLMSSFGLPSAGYPASARWHVFRFASFAPSQPTQANPSPASSSCVSVSCLPPSLPLISLRAAFGRLPSQRPLACVHVCRIQAHRSRARYRHGSQGALDHCAGVVHCWEVISEALMSVIDAPYYRNCTVSLIHPPLRQFSNISAGMAWSRRHTILIGRSLSWFT